MTYKIETFKAYKRKDMKTGIFSMTQPLCSASIIVNGKQVKAIRNGATAQEAIVAAVAALQAKLA